MAGAGRDRRQWHRGQAARITPRDASTEPFIAISMYGRWIGSHPSVKTSWSFGYADASVHRIISDLSTFIGHENSQTHRILAAGDLNILHGYRYGYGYGDGGRPPYWEAHHRSVFERMEAIELEFIGPQAPDGRQPETLATHKPADSRNVVTFYLSGRNPATASNNQLDYVFASRMFIPTAARAGLSSIGCQRQTTSCLDLLKSGLSALRNTIPSTSPGRR